jgi:predicted dehydrogenase
MSSVRIALIGAGIFARETYIQHFNQHSSDARLTAILSRSAQSIDAALAKLDQQQHQHEDVAKFTNEDEFFAAAPGLCDAVIVCVPIPLLGHYVEKCLRKGLHVLSEKPVAMTCKDAQRLIAVYRGEIARVSPTTTWHVAENYRVEPAVRYARGLVREHSRKVKYFNLVVVRPQSKDSKYMQTNWRSDPQYAGSSVFDGGIHFVALLRAIVGGDVSEIRGVHQAQDNVEVASCGSCRVGGALGSYQMCYGSFSESVCRLDVFFEDATLSVVQKRGVGYLVSMSGHEEKSFPLSGFSCEFQLWLGVLKGKGRADELSPEEGLADLNAIEQMCK